MEKETFTKQRIFIALVVIIAGLGIYSFLNRAGWVLDAFVILVIMTIAYLLYEPLRLTKVVFALGGIAFVLHLSGVFGFYEFGLFNIPYDIITHFVGIFAATLWACNILSPLLQRPYTRRQFTIFFFIVLSGIGVGSLIENAEYVGYLIYGEGKGGFRFGAGDIDGDFTIIDELTAIVGGGYFDTMYDLLVNLAAAILAAWLFAYLYYKKKRNKI